MTMERAEVAAHRAKLERDFRELLAGTEALLRSTASYGGEEIESVRDRLRHQLDRARDTARDWERGAVQTYRHASAGTEAYVHDNVWKSLGIAAVAGALIGILAAARR